MYAVEEHIIYYTVEINVVISKHHITFDVANKIFSSIFSIVFIFYIYKSLKARIKNTLYVCGEKLELLLLLLIYILNITT